MNDSDDVRQLLTEMRDLMRESVTMSRDALARQKKIVEVWFRMVVAASVLLGILLAALAYLFYLIVAGSFQPPPA